MNSINLDQILSSIRDVRGTVVTKLTPDERSKYIAGQIGVALGSALSLPSSPIDIPRNFYLTQHSERVGCILAEINEVTPINVALAAIIADNVYTARYRLVFEGQFFAHLMGHLAACSDDVVPKDLSDILKKACGNTQEDEMYNFSNTRMLYNAVAEALNCND